MSRWQTIMRVAHREISRIVHNPRYPILLTVGFIFTFVLFASITHNGQPTRW